MRAASFRPVERVESPVEARASAVLRALLAVVHFYRTAVSPLRPPRCRYVPSCSAYAETALRQHGLARGSVLAARRLLRCHPFAAGGIDHVPSPPRPHEGVPT